MLPGVTRRLGVLVLGLVACRPAPAAPRAEPPPPVEAPATPEPGVPTAAAAILSAHFARADDPGLDGLDGLMVVFDVELDAAAMQPRAFVVSRANAGPVWPQRAIFAPASEDDENRSVLLVGEFGEATDDGQPTHVAVNGPLFAEDGRSLAGLGAAVLAYGVSPRIVAAQSLPVAEGRCEGAAQLLRTYWTDELRGVEPEDLRRVRMQGDDGESVHPVRFDDHRPDHAEAGQDNVLDLCIAESSPIRRVWVEAGAFRDVAGHPSAAIELRVGG